MGTRNKNITKIGQSDVFASMCTSINHCTKLLVLTRGSHSNKNKLNQPKQLDQIGDKASLSDTTNYYNIQSPLQTVEVTHKSTTFEKY